MIACKDKQRPWARIVIVAYNSGEHLQRCVDHLGAQTFDNFEVVIIDNDTPDNCVENLIFPDSRFTVLQAGENLGFAAGCNLGVKDTSSEWVIMLNPDCFAQKDWLEQLEKASRAYLFAASLASVQLTDETPARIDGCGDVLSVFGIAWRGGYHAAIDKLPTDDKHVFSACGAAAAYRTDIFLKMHGFDEKFFCYLEDVDLGLRLQLSGGACVLVCKAYVTHIGSTSTGKESYFQFYHSSKNNLRLLLKSLPLWNLAFVLPAYILTQLYFALRNPHHPQFQAKIEGHKYALRTSISALADRRKPVKIYGAYKISLWKLLKFNPKSLGRHDMNMWSISKRYR